MVITPSERIREEPATEKTGFDPASISQPSAAAGFRNAKPVTAAIGSSGKRPEPTLPLLVVAGLVTVAMAVIILASALGG